MPRPTTSTPAGGWGAYCAALLADIRRLQAERDRALSEAERLREELADALAVSADLWDGLAGQRLALATAPQEASR